MNNNVKQILPQGFYDRLGADATESLEVNYQIIKRLELCGYDLIQPSVMEFEEVLDKNISSDFFKVTDSLSNKMMVLRNDITPQISRIIKDNNHNDFIGDRIAYTGTVFRKTNQTKYSERQILQTGFEIIGSDVENDVEAILVAIEVFESLDITEYTIDVCYPIIFDKIITRLSSDEADAKELRRQFEIKNFSYIRERLGDVAELFETCEAIDSFKDVTNVDENSYSEIKNELQYLKSFAAKLAELLQGKEISVNLNLFENSAYPYHKGPCFSFISQNNLEEIGRGGRYIIDENGADISACGFTFLMNSIMRNYEAKGKETKNKNQVKLEDFFEKASLRDKGEVTIIGK